MESNTSPNANQSDTQQAVCVFTRRGCPASDATVTEFRKAGICFSTVSAEDYPATVAAAGMSEFPTVVADIANERIVWAGFQADLTDLLSDFVSEGPIPIYGLGDEDTARHSVMTRAHVIRELGRHGASPAEFFEECGCRPLYRGSAVLDFLGY